MMKSNSVKIGMGLLTLGLAGHAQAWDSCDNERILEETLNVQGTDVLEIVAAAGDLEIRGEPGLEDVVIKATICASKEEYLEETRLETEGGSNARIATVMPDVDWGWSGNQYLYMDLEITVPQELTLDVRDSSGDVSFSRVGDLSIQDSSGDIDIESAGSVELQDSSGDIELEDINGDVLVRSDSSGDIEGEDISGSVLIARDSSGDIEFSDIAGDYIVERDSSGDISAKDIQGDFVVEKDGSGSIDYIQVTGEVRIPENKT